MKTSLFALAYCRPALSERCLRGGASPAPAGPDREGPKEGWSYFFGGCSWYCGAPKILVSATSFLTESEALKHPPQQAHDSNMQKVWSEGVEGNGTGEMLSFTFITTEKDTTDLGVTSCAIATGHQGSNKLFRQNARPKTLELVVDGRAVAKLELQDEMGLQWFEIPKVKLARPSKHVIGLKSARFIRDRSSRTAASPKCISRARGRCTDLSRGDERFREYAVQTALAALQCAVIQVGTLISTILLRSAGYPDPAVDWPWLPVMIREWGPLAFAIPGVWVTATILLERRDAGTFTKRWTIVSGLLLAVLLAGVYGLACSGLPSVLPR